MTEPHRDRLLMERAIALAERGGGATSPNPMVGCVIADAEGRILGEGFHHRAGESHAEVLALRAAAAEGREVRGATVFVTLEPCAHQGRTPPCVEALIAAGVGRVVFAAADPHVGRGGAARLLEAGLEVEGGLGAGAAAFLIEPWLHFVRTGRPFLHLKSAITLNGRLTRGEHGGRWITGAEARRAVHRLRRRYPAIVVGIGTALADDPLLTVRDWPPEGGPPGDPSEAPWPRLRPLRVVLDPRLRLPADSRLATSAAESPVLVLCGPDAPVERVTELLARGVEVLRVPAGDAGLDLEAVTALLAERGATGALVEPGPTLARALVEAGLAQRWTMFLAPDWEVAPDALPLWPEDASAGALHLRDPVWETHGPDVSVSGLVS